ncbi:MAG: chromosomal replication initiator protein DnaA [Candidatus Poribacteria bacterium]|nr:chromosomal replication initiator protein DnaA [Candidatus Poribacteria bacterium]MYC73873.1 chromosomal replication initiator protein DnaA [Gemmatimonadota bacterium]
MALEIQDPQELWAQCLLNIERQVRPQSFTNWFKQTSVSHFDQDLLVIQVPSAFSAAWIEEHYLQMIQSVVWEETTLTPNISFVVTQAPQSVGDQVLPVEQEVPANEGDPAEDEQEIEADPAQSLNKRYTFEEFIIGDSNQIALATALAVANAPGKTEFNPLVIYGGAGLGKTHLLQAIGHRAHSLNLAKKVVYVTSEKFMGDFVQALAQGRDKTSEFKNFYRSADILLVDDIQFLLHGERTQNEFFHTFNALHQSEKQIVMTCDSAPGHLDGLEERLKSRFIWGLATAINPPELETRIAILHKKAERNGIRIPDNVAALLGNHIRSNVRELEGTLISLMAYCSIQKKELDIEAAKHILDELGPNPSEVSIEAIQQQVADHFNLTREQLIGKGRKQDVATARHIAMFLIRTLLGSHFTTIGLHFGNRDHSTVIHAVNTVEKRCKNDPSFARLVEDLSDTIRRQSR